MMFLCKYPWNAELDFFTRHFPMLYSFVIGCYVKPRTYLGGSRKYIQEDPQMEMMLSLKDEIYGF